MAERRLRRQFLGQQLRVSRQLGDGDAPGGLGDATGLGGDDEGDAGRLGDAARLGDAVGLGDADGEGAGLDEGPGRLLGEGRPELAGLPGRVTPGESHGPVSAPGAAAAAGLVGDPARAARTGGPAR